MADNFAKISKGISLPPQSGTPTNPGNGDAYYDNGLGLFQFREAGVWKGLGSGTGSLDVTSLITVQNTVVIDSSFNTTVLVTLMADNNGEIITL